MQEQHLAPSATPGNTEPLATTPRGQESRSIRARVVRQARVVARDLTGFANGVFAAPSYTDPDFNYEAYWQRRGPHDVMPRHPILAGMIREGAHVLDVGCGDGTFLEYVARERGATGFGLDISESALDLARKRGLDVARADLTDPAFEVTGTFDSIVISEVLEHLPRPEDVLLKLRDRFRDNLLVSVPNTGYVRDRLRLAFGRVPVQWVQHPSEHLRYWTVRDFVEWAEALGFRVVSVKAASGAPVVKDRWMNLFAQQMVYELRRAGDA